MEQRIRGRIPNTQSDIQQTPEVSVTNISAEDKLIEFVEKQIESMRKYTYIGNGAPSFFELNEALIEYSNMNCGLISLDVIAKIEYQKAKDDYDEFIAEKYIIIRNEHNLQSVSAQKWLSTQEITYYVQTDKRWNNEYKQLRDNLNNAEKKLAFCRRLLDNMESFKYNLGVLSKNIQAESLNLNATTDSLGLSRCN